MGRFWVGSGKDRHRTPAGNRHEYETYGSTSKAKKDRASRNSARRSALRSGKVHLHDGKEIDHKNSNPRDNRSSNLRVVSRTTNRSKRENSRLKGSKRNHRKNWGTS